MKRRQPLRTVFGIPFAIGLASFVGLVSALTGDGARDALSWLALAIPVGAVGCAMRMPKS